MLESDPLQMKPAILPSEKPVTSVIVLTVVAAFLFYLLGNGSHSLWDRDESRFATASLEMLTTGDYVVPRFNGDIRYDKPVLIYYLQTAAMRVFGVNEFAVRFPAAVGGSIAVLATMILGLGMGLRGRALWIAGIALGCSPLVVMVSKASTTDGVLLATVTTMLALHWYQLHRGFRWWRHVAFWLVLTASVLLKGPPGPLVVGLTVVTFSLLQRYLPSHDGQEPAMSRTVGQRILATGVGLVILLSLGLPWALAVHERTDGTFFDVAVGKHVIERTRTAMESHGGPVVYYFPVMLLASLPLTPLVALALRWAVGARRQTQVKFLAAWLLPSFVVFSFAATKLPHYVAPLVPALALLVGLFWQRVVEGATWERDTPASAALLEFAKRARGSLWLGSGLTILAGLGIAVGGSAAIVTNKFDTLVVPGFLLCAALGVTLAGVGVFALTLRLWRSALLGVLGFAMAGVILMTFIVTSLEPLRASKPTMAAIEERLAPTTQVMAAVYQEPSLVFYHGRKIEMIGRDETELAFRRFETTEPTALVITEGRWRIWCEETTGTVPRTDMVHDWQYFNFQRGRWQRLVVVANPAAMGVTP